MISLNYQKKRKKEKKTNGQSEMEKELLQNLGSSNIRDILNGLNTANTLVEKYELQNVFVDKLYHSLVPLLTHTHFKIRSRSFNLIEILLSEYTSSITCPDVAIPSILLSILAVHEAVADSALSCLHLILGISDTEVFWPDIEGVILESRSTNMRIKILDLLCEFVNKIPLSPIIKLLDDPKAQIRNAAKAILDLADPACVKAALNQTRISFEAMEKLIAESAYDLADPKLAARDVKKIAVGNRTTDLVRKRATQRRKAADERNSKRKKISQSNSTLNPGSPRSYTSISQKRRNINDQNESINSSIKQDELIEAPNVLIPNEESELDYNAHHQIRSSISTKLPSVMQKPTSMNQIRTSMSSHLANDKNQRKPTSSYNSHRNTGTDDENEEFLRIENEISQESQMSIQSNNNRPLGKIIPPPRVSLPVKPRDLSTATWLERVTFLEKLKESLAKSIRFKESPSQILDCVLTTSVPSHKKVTFLIPPILSEIILHHPEVLNSHLSKIVEFTLNTMVSKAWQTDTQFSQFLSVLILESDPIYLIDQALKISDKSTHPLPFDIFILRAYEVRDDIILPYNIVSHIISQLVKKPGMPISVQATLSNRSNSNTGENRDATTELFTLICIKEMKHVQRFGSGQSQEIRKKIIPYLKIAQQQNKSRNEVYNHRTVDLSHISDIRELKQIIDTEMSKGAKSDIPKLVAALVQYPNDKCQKLFVPFILFIASLPQRIADDYELEFVNVCVKHFRDPALLSFLDNDFIEPKVIVGLSRSIWNCPSSILDGSENYLPFLYKMFKESIGSTRYELVQLFLAIFQKTRVSVLDLPEMKMPYKKLIDDMMSQFRIIPPKS